MFLPLSSTVKTMTLIVPPTTDSGVEVLQINARDGDEYSCPSGHSDCPCGKILYSIESGNYDHVFEIDRDTGRITTTGNVPLVDGEEFQLLVASQNAPPAGVKEPVSKAMVYASLTITVGDKPKQRHSYNDIPTYNDNIYDGSYDPDALHHRSKRVTVLLGLILENYHFSTLITFLHSSMSLHTIDT